VSRRGGDDDAALRRAVAAWRELEGVPGALAAERLSGGRHSAAVRLRTGAGTSVVAKLRRRGELDLERAVHEQVLPLLGVPTPACLGFARGRGDEDDVLFLEDLGDRAFRPTDPRHQRAAAVWLGRCHAVSTRTRIPDPVPRRSAEAERERILASRVRLADARDNPALGDQGAASVGRVLALLASAEQRWAEWATALASAPAVLTHGAFLTRNVRMRGEGDGLVALPFDWDHVAVRSPAIDLASAPGGSRGFAANASLEHYRLAAAASGLSLEPERIAALAAVGTLIRAAACIGWLVSSLAGPGARQALSELEIYRGALAAALGGPP
jgi:hypothetical protein